MKKVPLNFLMSIAAICVIVPFSQTLAASSPLESGFMTRSGSGFVYATHPTEIKSIGATDLSILPSGFGEENVGELNSSNIATTYNCPAEATVCNLMGQGITSIAPDTFVNHTNLTFLDLRYNQITSLSSGVFNGLFSLNGLALVNNQITTISSNAFDGLSTLNRLDLTSNQLISIPNQIFNDLPSLLGLSLGNNQISSLPSGVFNGLSNLQYLGLGGNQITFIQSGVFDTLSNIQQLQLSEDQITFVENGVFDGLLNLQQLTLYNNCGSETINYATYGSSMLDTNNCVPITTDDANDYINQLTNKFYTNGGGLLGLGSDYYIGTMAIDFSHATTSKIFANTVMKSGNHSYSQEYYNTSVEVQYSSETAITDNGAPFTGVLHSPELFPTSEVPLVDTTVALIKFGDLTHKIDFSKAVTVRIPALGKTVGDSIGIYSSEKEDIYGTEGPAWMFEQTGTVIDINGIPYVQFITNHAGRYLLGTASIYTMPQKALPVIIVLTGGLNSSNIETEYNCPTFATFCDLSNRGITDIAPDTFINHTNLQQLNLNNNQISVIENGTFNGLSSLNALSLANNQISIIENGAFNGLSSLNGLGLNNNQITSLSSGVFNGLSAVTRLDFSSNQITSLPADIFDGLSTLNRVDIFNNCGNETINYVNGSTSLDTNNCVTITTEDSNDFINQLNMRQYYNSNGGGLLGLGSDYYIGGDYAYGISFFNAPTSTMLASTVMKSTNQNNHSKGYYSNALVEVQYDSGTRIVDNGAPFTGVLHNPELFQTINDPSFVGLPGVEGYITLMRFGDLTHRIDFSKPVTVRVPLLDNRISDKINIYSSYDRDVYGMDGAQWNIEIPGTIIDINGTSYIQFTTKHAGRYLFGNNIITTIDTTAPATDTTAPVITLNGYSNMWVDQGSSYIEPGVSARDNTDEDINDHIVVSGSVNTNILGIYTITYNVSDAAGNPATEVTRTVTVGVAGNLNSGSLLLKYHCANDATDCDLSNQGITSIAPDTFINHYNLTTLNLGGNQLTSLTNGIFNGLSSLNSLYLDRNQLTSLPSGTFNKLSNLQNLGLDSNQIRSISSGAFNGLSNLQGFSLGGNELTSLPSDLFNGVTKLQVLGLDRNQLTSLPSSLFNGLSNLQNLYLHLNQLTSLPSSVFNGLSNLTTLNLDVNKLTSLPSGIFNGLSNLQDLWLDRNQLTSLPSGLFNGLSNLKHLYLHFNQLTSLPSGILNGLSSLQQLLLYNNCGTGIINYANGSTSLDADNCAKITTANASDFGEQLTNKSYTNGGGLLGLGQEYYVGNIALDFSTSVTNTILANTIMKSINSNSGDTQTYYNTPVEVQYDSGTAIDKDNIAFTGVLYSPQLYTTTDVPGMTGVVSLVKFGASDSIYFSKPVTVRISALGETVGAHVGIYSSITKSIYDVIDPSWVFEQTGTVININGVSYVQFTTTHGGRYVLLDQANSSSNMGYNNTGTNNNPSNTAGTSNQGYGGVALTQDVCPGIRDCSDSYYDRLCGKCSLLDTITQKIFHGAAPQGTGNITNSKYSTELNNAYLWAYGFNITTMPTIQTANMEGKLIRKDMAKMIASFAVNVLKKDISTGATTCNFIDTTSLSKETQYYITTACRLGLMGYESNGLTVKKTFNPDGEVDRGQFGTMLSRLLREDQNNGGNPYYAKHLSALKTNNIMTKIDIPTQKELRGYVMLMMMRAVK